MKTNRSRVTQTTIVILTLLLAGAAATVRGQSSEADQQAMVWKADDTDLKWGPCPAFMPDDCRIAVLQGNPKQPNTDVFFKMQPNTTVPKHWHHSPERMVLVSGEMKVNYDGQDPEVIKTGNYAYGPAERPHSASCLSDDPCVLFIAFEDPVDAFAVSEGDE